MEIYQKLSSINQEWIDNFLKRAKEDINSITEEEVLLAASWAAFHNTKSSSISIKVKPSAEFRKYLLLSKYKGIKIIKFNK